MPKLVIENPNTESVIFLPDPLGDVTEGDPSSLFNRLTTTTSWLNDQLRRRKTVNIRDEVDLGKADKLFQRATNILSVIEDITQAGIKTSGINPDELSTDERWLENRKANSQVSFHLVFGRACLSALRNKWNNHVLPPSYQPEGPHPTGQNLVTGISLLSTVVPVLTGLAPDENLQSIQLQADLAQELSYLQNHPIGPMINGLVQAAKDAEIDVNQIWQEISSIKSQIHQNPDRQDPRQEGEKDFIPPATAQPKVEVANLRATASVSSEALGKLSGKDTLNLFGSTIGDEGLPWYWGYQNGQLVAVRHDVVNYVENRSIPELSEFDVGILRVLSDFINNQFPPGTAEALEVISASQDGFLLRMTETVGPNQQGSIFWVRQNQQNLVDLGFFPIDQIVGEGDKYQPLDPNSSRFLAIIKGDRITHILDLEQVLNSVDASTGTFDWQQASFSLPPDVTLTLSDNYMWDGQFLTFISNLQTYRLELTPKGFEHISVENLPATSPQFIREVADFNRVHINSETTINNRQNETVRAVYNLYFSQKFLNEEFNIQDVFFSQLSSSQLATLFFEKPFNNLDGLMLGDVARLEETDKRGQSAVNPTKTTGSFTRLEQYTVTQEEMNAARDIYLESGVEIVNLSVLFGSQRLSVGFEFIDPHSDSLIMVTSLPSLGINGREKNDLLFAGPAIGLGTFANTLHTGETGSVDLSFQYVVQSIYAIFSNQNSVIFENNQTYSD